MRLNCLSIVKLLCLVCCLLVNVNGNDEVVSSTLDNGISESQDTLITPIVEISNVNKAILNEFESSIDGSITHSESYVEAPITSKEAVEESSLLANEEFVQLNALEPDDYLKLKLSATELDIVNNHFNIIEKKEDAVVDKIVVRPETKTVVVDHTAVEISFKFLQLQTIYNETLEKLKKLKKQLDDFTLNTATIQSQNIINIESIDNNLQNCNTKLSDLSNREISLKLLLEEMKINSEEMKNKITTLEKKIENEKEMKMKNVDYNNNNNNNSTSSSNEIVATVTLCLIKYIEILSTTAVPIYYIINKIQSGCAELYDIILSYRENMIGDYKRISESIKTSDAYEKIVTLITSFYDTIYTTLKDSYGKMSDALIPMFDTLKDSYIIPTWNNKMIPLFEQVKQDSLVLYYNLKDIITPQYKQHMEPHVLAFRDVVLPLYNEHLRVHVNTYILPAADYISNKLNRVVYFASNQDMQSIYSTIKENVIMVYYNTNNRITILSTYLKSNEIVRSVFGSYTDEAVPIILISITILFCLYFRKLFLALVSIILLILFSPVIPIVYIFTKLYKLLFKSKNRRARNQNNGNEEKKPAISSPPFNNGMNNQTNSANNSNKNNNNNSVNNNNTNSTDKIPSTPFATQSHSPPLTYSTGPFSSAPPNNNQKYNPNNNQNYSQNNNQNQYGNYNNQPYDA